MKDQRSAALMTILFAAAVGFEPGWAGPGPSESPRLADEAFAFLTQATWCSDDCYAPPDTIFFGSGTCHYLHFRRNGTLRRWARTDAPMYDLGGTWNFQMKTDTSGVVTLAGAAAASVGWAVRGGPGRGSPLLFEPPSDGEKREVGYERVSDAPISAIGFRRRGDRLWFGRRLYRPCPRSAVEWSSGPIAEDSTATPEKLGAFAMPAVMEALTRGIWRTQDEFNLFMRPDGLTFRPDMTCTIRFRQGECLQEGRFGVDGTSLYLEVPSPGCDERNRTNIYENRTVDFFIEGDTLLFEGQFFVRDKDRSDRRRAVVEGNHGDLRLVVEYRGPLRTHRANTLFLTYRNLGLSPVRLKSLRVKVLQLLEPDGKGGLRSVHAPQDLASRTYAEREIAVGGGFRDTIQISPTIRGDRVALRFEWDSFDQSQPYHSKSYSTVKIR